MRSHLDESTPMFQKHSQEKSQVSFGNHLIVGLRALFAEFIGSFLFMFIGCGTSVSETEPQVSTIVKALTQGGLLIALSYSLERRSGAVFNPAVTMALVFVRSIPILIGVIYVVAQLLGAVVGALVLYSVLGENSDHLMMKTNTELAEGVSPVEGMFIELILTFFLVSVVIFVEVSPTQKPERKPLSTFVVGGAVLASKLFGEPLTGAGMNPARSFGPALVTGFWKYLWVYWVGPLLGSALAVLYSALEDTSYFFRKETNVWM